MNEAEHNTGAAGWWQRLSAGLRRTSSSLGGAITDLVSKRKLDRAMIEEIEDALVRADLGLTTAERIATALAEGRYDKAIAPEEGKAVLADEGGTGRGPVAVPRTVDA